MNWTLAIIQAIVIAGISALISYLISTRQKRLDFTYNYRAYILDKRKEAYVEIEQILPAIRDKNIRILTTMKLSSESFTEINDLISLTREKYGFWISEEINQILTGIQKIYVSARVNSSGEKHLTDEFFTKFINETYKKTVQIEECYFRDIIRLDDIDAFKKAKIAYHKKQMESANDPLL